MKLSPIKLTKLTNLTRHFLRHYFGMTQGVVLISTALLCLSACGPVKMKPQATYQLAPTELTVSNTSRSHLTLLVNQPVAEPGIATDSMVYTQVPYQLQSFADSRWAAPPAEMWLPMLADQIRARGYFNAVVVPPFAGATDYRLDTSLSTFQQEFYKPISQVRVAVQATLVNNKTGDIVASRRFTALTDAPANSPYSGVLAANDAFDQINRQIAMFVVSKAGH